MENNTIAEGATYPTTFELSIRRASQIGLPGDDVTIYNLKVGSALNKQGGGPLKGLDYDEERKYLPNIIQIDPKDQEWRVKTGDYWSNIAVPIPADGVGTAKLQGKVLKFTIRFKSKALVNAFEAATDVEEKAKISKQGDVVEGVADYVLFRYCLVYGRVANRLADAKKSPKIRFYLHSKDTEVRSAHIAMKQRAEASVKFTALLDKGKEKMVDAILLMFDQNLASFDDLKDKHLALEGLVSTKPVEFLTFMEDSNLGVKATIRTAVDAGIIHKPAHTDTYYFGENNEITLGTTLLDAVLYWKSDNEKNRVIVEAITARLKQI